MQQDPKSADFIRIKPPPVCLGSNFNKAPFSFLITRFACGSWWICGVLRFGFPFIVGFSPSSSGAINSIGLIKGENVEEMLQFRHQSLRTSALFCGTEARFGRVRVAPA